ncbi:MAG: YncE family protein [Nitrospirota bacterium]
MIKSRSLMLDMSFDYAGSVGNAISFSPYFKVFLPEKIVTNLIGCSTNTGSDNINVFNKFTREVVGVITMGHDPAGMALDQNLRRLYVAASGSDEIEVIDLETGEFLNRIRLNNGDTPQEIGLTPDGGTLLVTNRGSGTVSFINTNTFLETNRIKVGDGPTTLLMDRTGTRAYVFNNISNSISVIQISNQAVAGTIPSESSPIRGQLNAAGTALYFIQANSPYLTVVNLPALSVANRVYIGLGLLSIKVDPATNYIFISKRDEDRLFVYDPFSFIPIDYILTDGDVTYMAIDGENNNLFLLIPEKKTIQVINLNSRRTLSDVGVLEDPYYVTMMGERF